MPLDDTISYAPTPKRYDPEFAKYAHKLALLGANNAKIAEGLGITPDCLSVWRRRYPGLERAIEEGGLRADAEMAHSYYHRAKGYEFKSEKVFCLRDGTIVRAPTVEHIPAEPGAARQWLASRQPELWVQRVDVNVNVQVTDARERNLKLIETLELETIEGPASGD